MQPPEYTHIVRYTNLNSPFFGYDGTRFQTGHFWPKTPMRKKPNTEIPFYLKSAFLSKVPGFFLFFIFLAPVGLVKLHPKAGLFFIAFCISYWTIKVFESYYFVLSSYASLLKYNRTDFSKNEILSAEGGSVRHLVVVPIYTEPYDVIEENVVAILENDFPFQKNITILLATEARAKDAESHAKRIIAEYSHRNVEIVNVVHPEGIPGEGKVKGANITYAVKEYEKGRKLDPHHTLVSTIDTDTKVEKNFFSIVTYVFLTTEYRDQAIYQYTPVYSNNWKRGTFFSRLIAMGTTLWQLFESQNPEFYRNFAVYGQTLHCLKKSDYWSLTSIVEDGLQYWRSYFAWDSKFRIVNVPAVCRMDVVEEETFSRTVQSQYKQLRRWSWGCTDVEYVFPEFAKRPQIPFWEKFRKGGYLIQNHLFWAGGPLMLFFIGYVPGIFENLRNSIAVLAVPLASSIIFTILFATVVFPSMLSIHIMKRYTEFRKRDYLFNVLQWTVLPLLTLTLFSLPAIESQLRLFFGKRLDSFETTRKIARK
jgi:cellulose synthase/poly-beta-1,6-N-acetylglucosamine synthase-like glycosyltransferase